MLSSVQMTCIICLEYSNTYESLQINIFICNRFVDVDDSDFSFSKLFHRDFCKHFHRYSFFWKNWKMPKKIKFQKMFRKNLSDKVSKMKNLRLLSSSFFRARRCGVLHFFGQSIFHRKNCKTKSPVFTQFQATCYFKEPWSHE